MMRKRSARMVPGGGVCSTTKPDPGASKYEQQEPFPKQDSGSLPGPMPYQPGQKRLSVGAFYEGGASDTIAVDEMTAHLYVYDNTVKLVPEPDHIEGKTATRAAFNGMTWWGFGVHWDMPRSLAAWTKMHVSLSSPDADYAMVQIGMNNTNPVFVEASAYGYVNDGQWHSLTIPVHDFIAAGLDVSQVAAPFVLTGGMATVGEKVIVNQGNLQTGQAVAEF